jgi:putative flippase GtrA
VLPLSLGLYLGAVGIGVDPDVARVLSYVVGTALVAVLHRRWTFRTPGVRGALAWTALLYATTFAVVLITHGLALAVLPMVVAAPWITAGAWRVSQGLGRRSTSWSSAAPCSGDRRGSAGCSAWVNGVSRN